MQATPTAIADVVLLTPRSFRDARGFFFESFNQRRFAEMIGRDVAFVQDNQSHSLRHVVRGLHYQIAPRAQGKLVRALSGAIFDVAIDIRPSSPTYGQHVSALLSAENQQQLWIPEGFAHGFQVVSESADVMYKTTDYWSPEHERAIAWNDAALAIAWPDAARAILSDKDAQAPAFSAAL